MFNAGLRGATSILKVVFDILLLHKFRRAPYGSGRFWISLKEIWHMLLTRCGGASCEIVAAFMEAIARDLGRPLSALSEPSAFNAMVRWVLSAPIGQKVEMRRWFTFLDAGPSLDKAWHTMLVALIVDFSSRVRTLGRLRRRLLRGARKREPTSLTTFATAPRRWPSSWTGTTKTC